MGLHRWGVVTVRETIGPFLLVYNRAELGFVRATISMR